MIASDREGGWHSAILPLAGTGETDVIKQLTIGAVALGAIALGHGMTASTMPATVHAAQTAQSGAVVTVTWVTTRPGRPDTLTAVNGSEFPVDYTIGFDGQPAGSETVYAGEYDGRLTGAADGQPSDTIFTHAYVHYGVCFQTGGVADNCAVFAQFVAYGGRSYTVTLAPDNSN